MNERRVGVEEVQGEEAARVAAGAERAAAAGGVDPLEGLASRVASEGRGVAFKRAVLNAAVGLRARDAEGFAALADALREVKGFSITAWSRAVDGAAREAKAEAKTKAEREARERVTSARDILRRARAEASEATQNARAAAAPDVAPHHADFTSDDDAALRYVMEPGRITVERPVRGASVETRTLARFSAAIVADVRELEAPTQRARRAFDLSVMLPGEGSPVRVDGLGADEFRAMQWPETHVGARAVVHDTGRRDELRAAIQNLSRPRNAFRYRFTGWYVHDGRPVYLHAGGALGEAGAVDGLRSEAAAPANAFDLSSSAEAPRGVAAVLELLSVSPATVVVPMVAASFRSVMGPSRLTVHVSGLKGTGKSLLAGLAQQLFGRSMGPEALPCSWADGSTANGIARVLARVGDAVVAIDDLRFGGGPGDLRVAELFDRIVRAHFNRAAALKLTRDGGQRFEQASRCVILSTGETPPRGHSTRDRAVCVELTERPSPDLSALMQRAAAGELARGMAAFVQWYAARYVGNLPRLDALERAASARWALGVTDRAAGLFGALALGAEVLFAWLAESGVDAAVVAAHQTRAREALTAVAREHGEGVEGENPARTFVPFLIDALIAGEAHIKGLRPDGRTCAPSDPELWGWRTDGEGARHQGKGVGWMKGAEVYINPGVALDVVRARAQRAGEPFPLDRKALARNLCAAGMLARTDLDKARPRHTTRVQIAGVRLDALVFGVEMFGVEAAPLLASSAAEGDASAVGADDTSSGASGDERPDDLDDHPAEG